MSKHEFNTDPSSSALHDRGAPHIHGPTETGELRAGFHPFGSSACWGQSGHRRIDGLWLRHPLWYVCMTRPAILPDRATRLNILPSSPGTVHMNQKLVQLVASLGGDGVTLSVTGPPNDMGAWWLFIFPPKTVPEIISPDHPVYSPGPGWIFVLADGIPSVAQEVMIGSGANPPYNAAATAKCVYQLSLTSTYD